MEVGFVNDKGKLTGVRKKRETTRRTEMQFADDAAAVFTTREGMVASARHLIDVARRWGLTVSVKKTEFMVVGEVEEGDLDSFEVEGGMINPVKDGFFQYLGSKIDCKGGVEADVLRRLGIASTVFGSLRRSVWNDKDLSARTKRIIYTACVWGTLNYGMEAWAIPAKLIAKLETFHNSCLRTIAGASRRRQRDEHITTEAIREKTGLKRATFFFCFFFNCHGVPPKRATFALVRACRSHGCEALAIPHVVWQAVRQVAARRGEAGHHGLRTLQNLLCGAAHTT